MLIQYSFGLKMKQKSNDFIKISYNEIEKIMILLKYLC